MATDDLATVTRPVVTEHDSGAAARDAVRKIHDCTLDHCDDDRRLPADIEREGFVAGTLGVEYDQCPYGRTHPDVRFNPWQRGRWKARGEWCDDHRQALEWCAHERRDGFASHTSAAGRSESEPLRAGGRAPGLATTGAPVYVSDADAFTDPWYQRRAAAYADDARKIVATLREYEDVHPDDAPCMQPLVDEIKRIAWRGHDCDPSPTSPHSDGGVS